MRLPTESQWARYSALCGHLRRMPAPEQAATLQALRAAGKDDPQVLSLVATHLALPPDPVRDRTGERLGNFTLEEPLGAGGMGVVYRAQQHLGPARRPVAVKLIHPALLLSAREEVLARFLAELHTLVTLQHEHIARIYDGGIYEDPRTHEQLPYIAMELVCGGLPLTTYARDYALSWQERLAVFVRVCHAVRYAHEHRVVHCDLKPANILVDSDGRPVVIDFGLAHAWDAVLPGAHLVAAGTPAYMSPEQVSPALGVVSEKSDVYALGLILYELLTEQHPYALPRDDSCEQWRQVVLEATPPPLRQYNAAYGGELEAILAAALAKQSAERISVAVLRARLERYLQQLPSARDRPRHDPSQAQRDMQSMPRQDARFSAPVAVQPWGEMEVYSSTAPGTLTPVEPYAAAVQPEQPTTLLPAPDTSSGPSAARHHRPEAERRQRTVMFGDLVGATAVRRKRRAIVLHEIVGFMLLGAFLLQGPWWPLDPTPLLDAASQALLQEDWPHAVKLCQRLQQRPEIPLQSQGYAGLAAAAWASGDHDQALAMAAQAEALDPDIVYSHVIRGHVLWAQGNVTGATEAYRTALDKGRGKPWQRAMAADRLGHMYDARGFVGTALKYYDAAIRQDANYKAVYAHKAHLLDEIGAHEEAQKLSSEHSQAFQMAPAHPLLRPLRPKVQEAQ